MSQKKCEEVGGEWKDENELCLVDDTSKSQEHKIASAAIIAAGAVLTATVVTSPIGIPLLLYGLARWTLPRDRFLVGSITFLMVLFVGILMFIVVGELIGIFSGLFSGGGGGGGGILELLLALMGSS